ncbi:MAG: TraR/DksA family transcriptional regulator [Gemmataceae bacterium]
MARHEALLRLYKTLTTRRDELARRIGMELEDLRKYSSYSLGGDSADAAFGAGSEEISSQLAELEARELAQIERAIARMAQGSYGICEGCQRKIPVARLNVLPYSTMCVTCQREFELYGTWSDERSGGDWEKVSDSDYEDREVDLSDLEIDLSK